jgi:lambda family phage portal protein
MEKPRVRVPAGSRQIEAAGDAMSMKIAAYGGGGHAAYEAGAFASRYMGLWQPPLVSADVATLPNIDNVSARAFDSIRNDPYLSNVVRIARDSIIGNGFRLRLHPDHQYLGITYQEATDWARKAQAHFRVHAESPLGRYSDAHGRQTFSRAMQTQLVMKMAAGEAVGLVRSKVRRGTRTRTCMQKMDPARIRNPRGHSDGDRYRKGVELDADGTPIAVHFAKSHPQDYGLSAGGYETIRVPLTDSRGRAIVLLCMNVNQVDQHRGISELVTSLVPSRMLSEFNRVHLESAIAQSVFAATIKSDLNYADAMNVIGAERIQNLFQRNKGIDPSAALQLSYLNSMQSFYRERAMQLSGAQVQHLAPHEELELHRPDTVNNGADVFEAAHTRRIAAGSGSPVHNMTQNYQQLSYASGRIAETNAWRHFAVEREHLSEDIGMPYAAAFFEEEILNGRLEMPGGLEPAKFYEFRDALIIGEFMSWGKPIIDPVKERKGQQLALEMGSTSLTRICDEEGVDLMDVIQERAFERDAFEEAGLPYPTGASFSVTHGENDGDSDDPDEDELKDAGVIKNA